MNIFIPKEEKTTKEYVRWTTITAFVVLMAWVVSLFHDEYRLAESQKEEAKQTIAKIEEYNARVEQAAKAPPPPQPVESHKKAKKSGRKHNNEPMGGGPPELPKATPEEAVASVPSVPVERDSKIEIDAILVKFAMSNEASWAAIIKMVAAVLSTIFGIKLINLVFRVLDNKLKPVI